MSTEEKTSREADDEQTHEVLRGLLALAREENRLTTDLVGLAQARNDLSVRRTAAADRRTELAELRTQYSEQQTKASTKSTELSQLRTEYAEHRTELAGKRTGLAEDRTRLANVRNDLSVKRTDLAEDRTRLANDRTDLSTKRTDLAEGRTSLAADRTLLSSYRSVLAKGRTELAFIRTGLSFVAAGIGLMRYFGLGPWTPLDGGLVVFGVVMTLLGIRGYVSTHRVERKFVARLDSYLTMAVEPGKEVSP